MKKKYVLALSGGGFKGAYQIGALRYLQENWQALSGGKEMHFDFISGVSVGALNGSLIACKKFKELKNIWDLVQRNGGKEIYHSAYIKEDGKIQLDFQQLKNDLLPGFKVDAGMLAKGAWNSVRRIFDKNVPGMMATVLRAAEKDFDTNFQQFVALASIKPLEEKLNRYIDLKSIPADTAYHCGTVSLNDGLYYSLSNKNFSDNKSFVQAILASASMPIIWPPVQEIVLPAIHEVVYNAVDGGIRNNSPLKDVVNFINAFPDETPFEVIIINCNSGYIPPMKKHWNIGDIALRALTEITLAEIFNDDIREFLKLNEFVKQAAAGKVQLKWKGQVMKLIEYKLIQPFQDQLGDMLDSRAVSIAQREQLGYEQAKKVVEMVS